MSFATDYPDVTMREWSSDEGMLPDTDERYAQRTLDDYRAMADSLIAAGVRHIAWVVPPAPAEWWVGWMSDIYSVEAWHNPVAGASDTRRVSLGGYAKLNSANPYPAGPRLWPLG